MVSARQELDLRPQLERLDALLLRSAGVEPSALSFEFRPLWQLSAAEKADVGLKKAQATGVYAGLSLWPAGVTARLVEGQLAEDGTYPNAEAIFSAGAGADETRVVADFSPDQPRDANGRWTSGGGGEPGRAPDPSAPSPSAQIASVPHAPDGTAIQLAQQTCADFIAAKCRASILREFPGEYLDKPLSQVYEDAANGLASARKAKKLLDQGRFRK